VTRQNPQIGLRMQDDGIPLPSWIPQLSGASYAMYSQAGVHTLKMGRKNADILVGLPSSVQRNYNAAETKGVDRKTLKFRRRVKNEKKKHYSMYVKGFVLDTVMDVMPSSQGGAIPQEWTEAGGWKDAPDTDPPDEFWRTLVADRGRDGRNPPVYYSRACRESFLKGGLLSGSVSTTDLINNERCSVVAQFCRRVQAVIWNRSLIITNSGTLGLASKTVQKGDKICILYGCSVPVVLRQSKKKADHEVEQEREEDNFYLMKVYGSHWKKRVIRVKELREDWRKEREEWRKRQADQKSDQKSDQRSRSKIEKTDEARESDQNRDQKVTFRIALKYGRRWRKIIRLRKELASWLAEWRRKRARPPRISSEPDTTETDETSDVNETKGSDDGGNYFYYKSLGECYIHGMMDGEAIAEQNRSEGEDKKLAQVFELR
jgi:hypothetical protein